MPVACMCNMCACKMNHTANKMHDDDSALCLAQIAGAVAGQCLHADKWSASSSGKPIIIMTVRQRKGRKGRVACTLWAHL